jgi:TolB-like protein/Tfp pilus assembly protein PilF
MSLVSELNRRNVLRVGIAYAVVAWLLLQVSDTLVPALHLPEWFHSGVALLLILGFPVALVFAWAFELTPDGIKKERDVEPSRSVASVTGRKLDFAIISLLMVALGYFAYDKFVHDPAESHDSAMSIAVLPFINMSSDPEQEYFSDGLSEELLNLLAGVSGLRVAARTSSFFYKDKLDTVTFSEIARELNVTHVLEGSVRKSGDKIRVTAQLIRADGGFHIWSETFDRTLDDVFAIQDEIAARVVASLKITLLGEAPQSRVTSAEAYDLTMQGRFFYNRRATGDAARALEYFERAVELDPGIAEAWIGLTPLYLWINDPPDIARARDAVEKALAIAPNNPEAHIRLAMVLGYEGNDELAQVAAQRAMELGPDNSLVQSIRSGWVWDSGDLEGAIEIQTRAVALDPLHVVNRVLLSFYLEQSGRLDDALMQVRKAQELSADDPQVLKAIFRIRLLQGYPEEAYEILEPLPEDFETLYYLANVEYTLGKIEAADAAVLEYQEQYAAEFPIGVAVMYAWRGNSELAFDWLNRAIRQDPNLNRNWVTDQFLSNLHGDPRWEEFVAHWEIDE